MPSRLRRRIDMLRETTVSVAGLDLTVDSDVLTVVAEAAYRHERLRFDCRSRTGEKIRRPTEPRRLVYTDRRQYLRLGCRPQGAAHLPGRPHPAPEPERPLFTPIGADATARLTEILASIDRVR